MRKLKDQTLTFEPYEHEVVVFGDRDRVGQVVNNIVTNAIKYSLEQASIRIFITEEEQFDKIHVNGYGHGHHKRGLTPIFRALLSCG